MIFDESRDNLRITQTCYCQSVLLSLFDLESSIGKGNEIRKSHAKQMVTTYFTAL